PIARRGGAERASDIDIAAQRSCLTALEHGASLRATATSGRAALPCEPPGQRPESGASRGADAAWSPGRETQPAVAARARRTVAPANTTEQTGPPTHRVRS